MTSCGNHCNEAGSWLGKKHLTLCLESSGALRTSANEPCGPNKRQRGDRRVEKRGRHEDIRGIFWVEELWVCICDKCITVINERSTKHRCSRVLVLTYQKTNWSSSTALSVQLEEIIFYANYSDIHGQHIILFEFMAWFMFCTGCWI